MAGKVGDFIVFKTTKTVAGNPSVNTMRVTLTELTDKTAATSTTLIIPVVDPKLLPAIPIPGIDAGVGLDPTQLPENVYSKFEAKPAKVVTEKETLTVAGKKLECTRVELTTAPGEVTRYWLCKDVPVTGLVKAELTRTVPGLGEVKTAYEVTEFGSKE